MNKECLIIRVLSSSYCLEVFKSNIGNSVGIASHVDHITEAIFGPFMCSVAAVFNWCF